MSASRYPSLAERKAARVAEIRRTLAALRARLAEYAQAHGGRFLLYGSAARDEVRYDSDVDLVLDFPSEAEDAAWTFAEEACWELKLEPDIMPASWCKPAFLERVRKEAVTIG
jgi:predicted nucleotidyltransferase